MEDNIMMLIDENGEEVAFEIIADFEVNDQEYAILAPVDDEEGAAVIFKVIDQGDDEPILEYLTDEDEFDFVAKAYEELLEEDN